MTDQTPDKLLNVVDLIDPKMKPCQFAPVMSFVGVCILKKVCWGLLQWTCRTEAVEKEIGNPVVTSVDTQATILE